MVSTSAIPPNHSWEMSTVLKYLEGGPIPCLGRFQHITTNMAQGYFQKNSVILLYMQY